ncbi:microtubule-associated proteins 1A/1B light chain 3C-like isoform X1 [Artemia franciscana]
MGLFRDNNHNMNVSFKERKTFAARKEEAENIRAKFPTKVPVIVQRSQKEKYLPPLDKTKFLVPQDLAMSQFITVIRNRMAIGSTQAFFLLINGKSMASMSRTLAEIYQEHKDLDGFLYVTYSSEETFGSNSSSIHSVHHLDSLMKLDDIGSNS